MAENETLDLGDRRNRRWRDLRDRVLAGAPSNEIASCLVRCVDGTMKRILRSPLRGGPEYPLADLVAALEKGRTEAHVVLARCHGHQYAQMLAEEPSGQAPGETLASHCERIGGNFLNQIELEAVPVRFSTFAEARDFRAEVERLAAPGIRKIARGIAAAPTKPPRTAPKSKGERECLQRLLLRESLLPPHGVGL